MAHELYRIFNCLYRQKNFLEEQSMLQRYFAVLFFGLFIFGCLMPLSIYAAESPKTFPYTVGEFEKAINGKVKAFGVPRWKRVQTKKHGYVSEHIFGITDRIVGNVTVPQGGKNIGDVLLILYLRDKDTRPFLQFLNSFAAIIDTLAPEIKPEKRGEILRDLGLLDGTFPTEQTTARKGNLAFTFAQLPDNQAMLLLVEPAK